MKLFKKLAAAVLAAVLALSMVGCGKANSVNATKQLVLDLIADSADQNDAEINNTAAMDGIAQNLLNKAAELYGSEGYAGKPVVTLLDAASKTEGMGFEAGKTYQVSCAEDYQFKSSLMQNLRPHYENGQIVLGGNQATVGSKANENKTKDVKVGFASGKLGDKTYVVMVMF